MSRKLLLWFLILVVPLILTGCAAKESVRPSGRLVKYSSEDYALIVLNGGYVLSNNVWNKGATSGPYEQAVFEETVKGKPAFGWQWRWPSSTNVVSYPEVIYGDKPWDKPMGLVAEFPFKAGSKSITTEFDITIGASGVYNLAFELWSVSALPASKDTITHEIMIWIANRGMTPAGAIVDTVRIGQDAFDVYVRKNHGDASGQVANTWTYIAFTAREPLLKGPLDIGAFVDYLLGEGLLTRDLYITSVELGNEIVQGSGIVEIWDYSVTIQ